MLSTDQENPILYNPRVRYAKVKYNIHITESVTLIVPIESDSKRSSIPEVYRDAINAAVENIANAKLQKTEIESIKTDFDLLSVMAVDSDTYLLDEDDALTEKHWSRYV
jgi:hypothetical protein